MRKLIQIGAGNIGRSFIGERFASSGFEVVFVDVDATLIDEINRACQYQVVIKHNENSDTSIWVRGIRGIHGADVDHITEEIAGADYVATSVGLAALPRVAPVVASGIRARAERGGAPLDIILAENIRDASTLFRREIDACLKNDEPEVVEFASRSVGLVETSIGKMVPIMTASDREIDPLWVFAEAYNTLIVDSKAFRGPLPPIDTLKPVESIRAYVDRKLFIHNLGHACVAYHGFVAHPERQYLYEVLADEEIADAARETMRESAAGLHASYPNELDLDALYENIDDLLYRFRNRSLEDTVYRVGRDLMRKLGHDDRLIGPAIMAARHSLSIDRISKTIAAAILFRATDESGKLFDNDSEFARRYENDVDRILSEVAELSTEDPVELRVREAVGEAFRHLVSPGEE